MRLSKRLGFILFGSATTAVIIGMVAVYGLIMPRFFSFEEQVVRGNVETVENALVQMLTGLHTRTRDWSTRPDVRAAVRGDTPPDELKLPDTDMGGLKVDHGALLWRDGSSHWLRGRIASESMKRLQDRFLARDCYSFWGIARMNEGAAMFALEPVGDSCHALVFAVSLDSRVASRLRGITGLPVELLPVSGDRPADARHIRVERLGEGRARGTFPLEAYNDEAVLQGRVTLEHPLYGRGLQTMFWTAVLLLVVALGIAAAVWLMLQRLVFQRLDRLHGTVRELARGGDLSRRVKLGGHDELSGLAEDFNQMVDAIRATRDELAQAREDAESASRAKSLFLANISHEIRTPMTAVLGYTDLMRREDGLVDQHRRYLDIIQENGDALLALINDVLDLSRIEAGEIQVEHRQFDLPGLLAEIMAAHALRAREKGLNFELDYASAVPDQVVTDPLRLRQILINLVGNAVKFTDAGDVSIHAAWEDGVQPFLHVRVHDTGIGIAESTLESIFQPFAQEDGSHTRRFGGSGLGLAIARELARSLGGDVEGRGEPHQGSQFHVWVRAVAAPEAQMHWPGQGDQAPRPAPAETVELSGTALVVEDNAVNRLFVKQVLESAGMDVIEAVHGEQALGIIERDGPPELVVMDMQMPIMDGFQAARTLRDQGHTLPILALTAHVMADHRRDCLEAGCDAFIGKPVRVGTLLQTCARLLDQQGHDAPLENRPGGTDEE